MASRLVHDHNTDPGGLSLESLQQKLHHKQRVNRRVSQDVLLKQLDNRSQQDFIRWKWEEKVAVVEISMMSADDGACQRVKVCSNFFGILSCPGSLLYQDHVDFQPSMESGRLRSALLFQHEQDLGSDHCLDGASLFLPLRLPEQETESTRTTGNGEEVEISVTLTNELPPTSY
ncbi:piwi-like protein 1 [Dunckerocampus dactyliophorus]|uniref:piwi-like protein 1 n=1 Tax=Dunckerocampus dactyliophorus TaxID=161453 RepID=UPI00240734AD|nr:piwi-like protein 1 [Dunckerocampus dactyliophorus]